MLLDAGWTIRISENWTWLPRALACARFPSNLADANYLLVISREPAGVVEAKRVGRLSKVAEQSRHYGDNLPDFAVTDGILSFTRNRHAHRVFFHDKRHPHPHPRTVFALHSPETLLDLLARSDILR